MAQNEILLPKMGESVAEATIIKWLKNEGDRVAADEPIVEIATDKVDSEVPAPQDGVLVKRLVNEGDVVKVGQPIAAISAGADTPAAGPAVAPPAAAPAAATDVRPPSPQLSGRGPVDRTGASGKFYSPLVRNIAEQEGVSMAELEAIAGSGEGGRVTKKDLLDYLPQARCGTGPHLPHPACCCRPATALARRPARTPAKPEDPR
jgi:pyruvate/2-oxoglutarate dehydrogenase complex dihydrolipoamide acyltransferase (E2) component